MEEATTATFPYKVRAAQRSILTSIEELTASGGTLLLDAPTGSGKTVAVLAPLLKHALSSSHKILYLTRTHSQATQVVTETRAIAKRSGKEVVTVTLEGREGRCPLLEGWKELDGANAEEYGVLCSDRKRATETSRLNQSIPMVRENYEIEGETPGCPYYANLLSRGLSVAIDHVKAGLPTGQEFSEWAKEELFCPYELAKALSREAKVVVAPYIMFLHPKIRDSLLAWLGVQPGELDIVLDEAHNLPEYLRDLASVRLSEETLIKAIREVEAKGDFLLREDLGALRFLQHLQGALLGIWKELSTEEGLLPEGLLEERLLEGDITTTHQLEEDLAVLALWGGSLREERRRERKLPRSYSYNVATFLLAWPTFTPPAHIRVAVREPRRELLAYALDARAAAAPIQATHLSIHMSGTLAPLEEYREALGLPIDSSMLVVPPSFPLENRRLFYSEKTTTRYADLSMVGALEVLRAELARVIRALPVKTAVFFPSFALLESLLKEGLREEIGKEIVIERRDLSTMDLWRLIDGFKRSSKAGVLMGVTGGRIAEGIDFPEEELNAVILVGIPYPRPTARREALQRYLDVTIGHGWEHCYAAPARRAMLQALGRMIRSEMDVGIGVILDLRAPRFAEHLPNLERLESLESCASQMFSGSSFAAL